MKLLVRIKLFAANGYLVVQLLEENLVVSESCMLVTDLLAALPNNTMPTDDDFYIHGTQRPGQELLTREQNEALLLAELKNKPT